MTIDPPRRSRAPVEIAPRARSRPVQPVSPPPRTRARPNPHMRLQDMIPDALPLPFMKTTHNGYTPRHGEDVAPDPRFAPLVIVMDPRWKTERPEYVDERVKHALNYQPSTHPHDIPIYCAPSWITEYGMRKFIKRALLTDEQFDAMEAHILANLKKINDAQGHILSIDSDGRLHADLTKNVGPFYCDTILYIEQRYAKQLTLC